MTMPAVPLTNTPDVRRWTGIAAIVVAVLLTFEFLLHLLIGPRPELDERAALVTFFVEHHNQMLLIVLVDTVLMASIVVFLAGFRQIITHARHDLQWISDVGFGAGLVFVAVTLVGDAMEAGSALDVVNLAPDASAIRALTEGHAVMFGATGCVLLAVVSASSGYVVLASRVLPRWSGVVAWVVAGLQVFGLATIFGGTSDRDWFSSGGVGVTATATFPWVAWVVVVGIVTIQGHAGFGRHRGRVAARPDAAAP
ncbi:hypothetical protein ACFPJ4_01925 [Lysinimonas soli]|uniref:DUF4386 family protein n=1 Tax=Lysinimonas soli TaxID=1074233 RepID=A0ABW0NP72_9MICO